MTVVAPLFPPVTEASEEGIVAVGGSLSVDRLRAAYSQGIFPWPHEGYPMLWFCPWERGILEFTDLHIPRSLRKFSKRVNWHFTIDQKFEAVITACARAPRPGQSGTWINSEVLAAYGRFHRAGYAHSLEVWDQTELIGGIYGVFVDNVFSAESMFFCRPNASKWAFWKLIEFLQNLGLQWIDLQMVTPVSESFGAKLIGQAGFLRMLRESQSKTNIFWT
jgi:leucyl/phenylalanyl-tRNA--protein transferase